MFAFDQVREMGEGRESRWSFLFPARWCLAGPFSDQIPLVFIVMAVETQQFPVAPVRGIVVMIVVLVVDRKLTQLFAVKVASAVCTDPRKYF